MFFNQKKMENLNNRTSNYFKKTGHIMKLNLLMEIRDTNREKRSK